MKFFSLQDSNATEQFAQSLANVLVQPCVIYLKGPLGAGKTSLVRALLRSLGVTGAIKSPTFALVEAYEIDETQLYHFDLYRLAVPEELEFLGIRDYLEGDSICLIEWPERAGILCPKADLTLALEYDLPGRTLCIEAHTSRGMMMLMATKDEIPND